jgi:hypothetical protein
MSASTSFKLSLEQIELEFDRQLNETIDNDTDRRFQIACSFLIAFDKLWKDVDEQSIDNDDQQDIKMSNDQENQVRCIFAKQIALVQPGDTKLLNILDNLFIKLQSKYALQLVFDILPRILSLAMLEDHFNLNHTSNSIEDKVLDMLQSLLEKSTISLFSTIIACASSLTLSVDGKIKVVEMIISVLPKLFLSDVPKVLKHLLRHITDNNDARLSIVAIRNKFKNNNDNNREDPVFIISTAQSIKYFISAISSPILRSCIAPAYIQVLEMEEKRLQTTTNTYNNNNNNKCLPIDVVILSKLRTTSEYKQSIDVLLFSWLSKDKIPFDGLDLVINTMLSNETSIVSKVSARDNSVSYNLIQMSILFFLSLLKAQASVTLAKTIERFAVKLFCSLAAHDRSMFVNSLFYILKNTLVEMKLGNNPSNSRSDSDANNVHPYTILSIAKTLKQIALLEAQCIVPLKNSIIQLLEYPFGTGTRIGSNHDEYPNDDIGSCLSDLLVIILKAVHDSTDNYNDQDEIKMSSVRLVSRLLSSRSSNVNRYSVCSSQTWGLLFASKLYQLEMLSKMEKEKIKDMVIRLALSETKQMVDPQVGIRVLEFLNIRKEETKTDEIFNYVKQLLSRTGLIQRKQNFETDMTSPPETLISRNNTNTISSPDQTGTKNYDIVFCIDFYSRNNPTFAHPQISILTTDWIFRLTDTYLQLCREKSFWKADRWLQASFQYPSLKLPTSRSRKMQKALDLLKKIISDNPQEQFNPVTEDVDEIAEILSFLEFEEIMKVKNALINDMQCLFIAGALSAAVFRNTCTQQNSDADTNLKVSFDHIKHRLDDFYTMKEKCNVIQIFLSTLSRLLLRRRNSKDLSNNQSRKVTKQSVLEGTAKSIPAIVSILM